MKIKQEIIETKASGGRVFLVGVQPGREVWWDILGKQGLTVEDFKQFNAESSWEVEEESILEVTTGPLM